MSDTPELIQWEQTGPSTLQGTFPLGIMTFVFSVWASTNPHVFYASCMGWGEGPLNSAAEAQAACEQRLQRVAEQISGLYDPKPRPSPSIAPIASIKPSDPVTPEKLLIMGFVRSGIDPSVLVYADAVVYESRAKLWRINAEFVPTALEPQCLGDVWKNAVPLLRHLAQRTPMPLRANAFKTMDNLQRECELARAIQSMPQDWAEIANGPSGTRCWGCDSPHGTNNRQPSAYADDSLNYATLCPLCQAVSDAYWYEMWEEHRNNR